eukprot:6227439-Prymnesium_polylepis.1
MEVHESKAAHTGSDVIRSALAVNRRVAECPDACHDVHPNEDRKGESSNATAKDDSQRRPDAWDACRQPGSAEDGQQKRHDLLDVVIILRCDEYPKERDDRDVEHKIPCARSAY